jgi:hypothetical protein
VCCVVSELSKFFVYRANGWCERAINWVFLGIKPIPIPVRASSVVVDKDVVWMSNPETGWSLIGIE